jgi:dihydrofolate synthase/folylpolyglutamate synthase
MPISDIAEVHQFLSARPSFKAEGKSAADFTLERFREFCAAIGNPQQQFDAVHVAGSNGKGSSCQLIASIYRCAGYKVGLYTSPHIISYEERFCINGNPISEASLVEFFRLHEAEIKRFRLTYFEISTAVAFWWFAREQVDLAVIETGLGGRLDSTNIITPLAAVITTVSLDHTDILGDTIEAIAAEKAGIIKSGVPVILGNISERAGKVLDQTAKKRNAPVVRSRNLKPEGGNGSYRLTIEGVEVSLQSDFAAPVQAYNIAAAWQLTRVLNDRLPVRAAHQSGGIRRAGTLFPLKARFEKLHPQLKWYFDGSHNLQAVLALKETVALMQPVEETTIVLSMMRDKITEKVMKEFLEFKKIIYHVVELGRAAKPKEIQQWLPGVQPFPVSETSRKALFKELESELVIFTGSFYFYATVQDWLSSYTISR